MCRGLRVGSDADGPLGFHLVQQNAILRANSGSSGECRLKPGCKTAGTFFVLAWQNEKVHRALQFA
jgi:hypothetical protein